MQEHCAETAVTGPGKWPLYGWDKSFEEAVTDDAGDRLIVAIKSEKYTSKDCTCTHTNDPDLRHACNKECRCENFCPALKNVLQDTFRIGLDVPILPVQCDHERAVSQSQNLVTTG